MSEYLKMVDNLLIVQEFVSTTVAMTTGMIFTWCDSTYDVFLPKRITKMKDDTPMVLEPNTLVQEVRAFSFARECHEELKVHF